MKRPDLNPVAKFISLNKVKMVRGYSYVSAFAIPFLVAAQISEMFPGIPLWLPFIFAVSTVWIIGHIDFHRLWKNELEYTLTKNPEWIKKMMNEKNEKK